MVSVTFAAAAVTVTNTDSFDNLFADDDIVSSDYRHLQIMLSMVRSDDDVVTLHACIIIHCFCYHLW